MSRVPGVEESVTDTPRKRKKSQISASSSGSVRKKDKDEKKKKKEKRSVGQYSLGDLLGRGGFGAVYKGMNMETGEFVALKQVSLKHCTKDQIDNIHSEINLLKKLHHERIVKYIDHKQSKTKLYIIIEYMENGSLLDIIKKFGFMNERLIAIYISQVLEGLQYLHSEGVIHRDIKGANILTTKTGEIKLADFGVASTLHDAESNDPVGTPYWMAPEIIELNPATPASDIWSVGATVIELLNGGEPPYFNLDPMPALYRIVQDEHPPLPPKISPACKDFLLKCFQKDPNLRNSASKLLNHVWIKTAIAQRNGALHANDDQNPRLSVGIGVMMVPPPEKKEEKPVVQAEAVKEKLKAWNEDAEEDNWEGLGELKAKLPLKVHETEDLTTGWGDEEPVKKPKKKKKPKKEEEEIDWGSDDEIDKKKKPKKPKKPVIKEEEPDDVGWGDSDDDKKKPPKKVNKKKDAWGDEVHTNKKGPILKLKEQDEVDWGSDWDDDDKPAPNKRGSLLNGTKLKPLNDKPLISGPKDLSAFESDEDEGFGDLEIPDDNVDLAAKLESRLGQSQNFLEDEDEDDPFQDGLESSFNEIEMEAPSRELEIIRQEKEVSDLIAKLDPDGEEYVLLDTCNRLVELFKQHPQMKSKLTQHHGVLPIMDMLNSDKPGVIHAILVVVNHLTNDYDIQYLKENLAFRETLCLVGVLPQVMKFSSPHYSLNIRKQACQFISAMCSTSALTLQMFIACRGLPVLVEFLAHDNIEHFELVKDMIYNAIDGIMQVFNIPEKKTRTPKNDFCRLFAKCNLMQHMSNVLLNLTKSQDPQHSFYLDKVMNILLLFSAADSIVKKHMAQPANLKKFFEAMTNLPASHKLNMIKCIKSLALDPATFKSFEEADAIALLVKVLAVRQNDLSNQILNALYSLCRVNKERQEMAAVAGIIPELQYIITSNSPLKHIALNMYCDLAHTSNRTRQELWKHDGVKFYVKHLMNVNGWQVNALEALREWMVEEPVRVQDELCRPENVDFVVHVFESASSRVLNAMLQPLQAILNVSVKLTRVLAEHTEFIKILKQALLQKASDVLVRVTQLKIVQSLYKWSEHPKRVMTDLYPVIKMIAKNEKAILVKELAQLLLKAFEENIKL